jgi:hypothetical protein
MEGAGGVKMARSEARHTVVMSRPDGFYSVDNEIVEDLAAEIGCHAFCVYNLLKSRSYRGAEPIGLREIARKFRMGKDSAAGAIRKLIAAGLVVEVTSSNVNQASSYVVEHAKDVLQARKDAKIPCPQSGTQKPKSHVLNQGHAVSSDKDAAVPEQGRHCPQIGTPNKEEVRNKKVSKSTPLAPASGGSQVTASQPQIPMPRERRETAAERQQRERAAVGGMAVVQPRARGENLTSADVRDGVRAALAAVRGELGSLLDGNDPALALLLDEWDGAFAEAEYESHEAFEGAAGGMMIRVSSPDPRATVKGIEMYSHRIEAKLRNSLGGRVALQVLSREDVAA